MYAIKNAICLTICAIVGMAQENASRPRHRYPSDGKITLRLTPSILPISLSQLAKMAEVIIDGTVTSALPAISTNEDPNVPLVETHSVIAINSVLSGVIPKNSGSILLAQVGGKTEKWDITVPDDPLVIPGERYIFFLLNDDGRKELLNKSGMPRYSLAGGGSGQVKISNGKIKFLPIARAELHKNDDVNVDVFLQIVKDTLTFVPKTKLPIHPTPPQK